MVAIEELRRVLDYDPLAGVFTWKIRPAIAVPIGAEAGFLTSTGRRMIGIDGRVYFAHRLAWLYMTGEWPADHIDHINGDPIDNRFANLRMVTRSQNQMNQKTRSTNTSGQKGVNWLRRHQKWQARITAGNKRFSLGYFDKFEDAVAAYKSAATKLHGEFARRE